MPLLIDAGRDETVIYMFASLFLIDNLAKFILDSDHT